MGRHVGETSNARASVSTAARLTSAMDEHRKLRPSLSFAFHANAGPRSNVTPVGCSHPAFSGAGFDATELAAITARVVVQATYLTPYPPLEYDWAIITFRGHPRWQSGKLERHPNCPRCR